MGRIAVKENTLRGFSFCLVQIRMFYTNSFVDSFRFIIVSITNVKCVTPAMGSWVSLLCESRFDLQSPQVLFPKLHFRTGNSECHVGVHEGGFGMHISVLVCYIPAKYQSWIQHQDQGGYVQKSDKNTNIGVWCIYLIYKFTTSVRLFVCDGRFRGWGKGQGGEAAGDPFHSLDQST
jgi:hypothetical protein